MNSKTLNTILIAIYLVLTLAYVVIGASVSSTLGMALWAVMLVFCFVSILYVNLRPYMFFLFVFVLTLILHYVFADSSPLSLGLILVNVVLYICLMQVSINPKAIVYLFLLIFLANFLIFINQIPGAIVGNTVRSYFRGMFRNPNSNALFAATAMSAAVMFIKDRKILICTLLLFIIYLLTCKSRNLLLFVVVFLFFYWLLKYNHPKWAIASFIAIMFTALAYLMIIEPSGALSELTIFGKNSGSAGRSLQILAVSEKFKLSLFGAGVDLPNNYSLRNTGYPIHNMYINTIYALGIVFTILYLYFMYVKVYLPLASPIAKAFLLSFHVYYFFEPGTAFYTGIFSIPLIFILLKLNEETHENNALHI